MQNLQDVKEKIFFETKTILDTLGKISSVDELLSKHDLFCEITDRVAFLRILEKNEESFIEESQIESVGEESHYTSSPQTSDDFESFDDASFPEDVIEEEVMFTNELNNIDPKNLNQIVTDGTIESPELIFPEEVILTENSAIVDDSDHAQKIIEKEQELERLEAQRREIVEISKHHGKKLSSDTDTSSSDTASQQAEKRFKLANIKGLKGMKQLFDNDPFDELEEESHLVKSNMKTDFMEAERRKHEFRLDLNDRVAFSKNLFGGDNEELTLAIAKLNSFSTLEEAKNYLSEMYHERKWAKADEYAQRLWNLVENKFM